MTPLPGDAWQGEDGLRSNKHLASSRRHVISCPAGQVAVEFDHLPLGHQGTGGLRACQGAEAGDIRRCRVCAMIHSLIDSVVQSKSAQENME